MSSVELCGQTYILAIVKDVTEHVEARRKIMEDSKRLSLAMASVCLGEWERNLEADETRVSDRWLEILGIEPDPMIDNYFYYWLENIHPEDKVRTIQTLQNHLEGHTSQLSMEYRFFHPLKNWIWLRETGQVFERRADGVPVRIISLLLDISEQKRSEQAIQEGEDRMALAMASARMGLWEWDIVADQHIPSDSLLEITGYDRRDYPVQHMDWITHIHEDDRDHVLRVLNDHLEGVTSCYQVEFRFRHMRKGWFWIYDAGRVTERNPDGSPARMIGLHMDITERKRMELDLREREENLQIMLNSIGDAVIATDAHGRILTMNPIAELLTGWRKEAVLGLELAEVFRIIDTETRMPCENPVNKVLHTGQIVDLSHHTSLISRDGKEYQISDSAAPIRSQGNEIQGVILVFHDVTEKYRQERALKESEEMFRMLFEKNNDCLAYFDTILDDAGQFAGCRFISVNPAFENVMGVSRQQVANRDIQEIWPRLEPQWLQCFGETAMTGKTVKFELYHQIVGRYFQGAVFKIQAESGRFAMSFSDITGQINAKKEIVAAKDRLDKILQTANCVVIIMDETFRLLFINDYAQKLLGYTGEEILGTDAMDLLVADADDRNRIRTRLHAELPDHEAANIVGFNRCLTRDERTLWIAWSTRKMTDPATAGSKLWGLEWISANRNRWRHRCVRLAASWNSTVNGWKHWFANEPANWRRNMINWRPPMKN